jgi:PAS domain S-box-containing protein
VPRVAKNEVDVTGTVEELQARLEEAEELLRAIRTGEIDALVVSGPNGDQVYTLSGAEHPYRVMVEAMQEGAVILTGGRTIVYSNQSFATMVDTPLDELIGSGMDRFVLAEDLARYELIRREGTSTRGEIRLTAKGGAVVPVYLSISSFESGPPGSACAVVTNLTEHKRHQELIFAQATERAKRAEAEAGQRRIKSILESITDSFFSVDHVWRVTDVNQHAAANLGKTRDELVGSVFWDTSPDGKISDLDVQYRRAMTERVPVHVEGPSAAAPGKWFERHIYPADDGLAVYFRDITERKRIEEHTAYQAKLLANVHDAIIATDDQFVLTAWNSAAEAIYGWRADEVLGHRFEDFVRTDVTGTQRSEALRTLAESGHYYAEVAQYTRDGKRIWMQKRTTVLRDEAGRVTGYVTANRDVTERKRADEKLREANERLEMILNSITDRFFGFDNEWRFTYFNKHAEEQLRALGKDPASLIGKVTWEEIPADPAVEEAFRRAQSERAGLISESYYPPLAEWVENRIYPSPDGGIAVFQRYVTERKRAESELRRSEALLAEGQRISQTGSWVLNVASGEMYWSREHFRICGVDPDTFELTWESARRCIHPGDQLAENRAFDTAIQERSPYECEFRIVRPDGTITYVISRGHPILSDTGELTEYVGTIMDITERKEAEAARLELRRRLVGAQEEERRRIAREMHDQFGQQLSALALKLSALKREPGGRADFGAQLASLEAIARQLDTDLELIVATLRPPALDDLGLVAALTHYVKRWSLHFNIHAELHANGIESDRLKDEIDIALYRITQEALNNVAKHAQAGNVGILLDGGSDRVSLIVEDDGVGFEAERADGVHQRFGLIGMRERAGLLGGTLDIESKQGSGTTVVVRIPLQPHPERDTIPLQPHPERNTR